MNGLTYLNVLSGIVLKHFFWPGMNADVVRFCNTRHTVVPPAPLHPIPVIGEPFEHVLVDCVGLLPKTKTAKQEFLGFSPAELVFGHNVRGPLKVLD